MATAWHFVGDTLRDGRPVPEDGETLVHDGPVEMCRSGLHASRRIIDALQYAPGHTVCRVEVAEIEGEDDDKLVCRERTILWRVDAEDILRGFARRCALDVIHLWDAPDVVREYLVTGDESKRTAAGGAARAAAWDAARGAARDAQNRRLTAMISAHKPTEGSTPEQLRRHDERCRELLEPIGATRIAPGFYQFGGHIYDMTAYDPARFSTVVKLEEAKAEGER